MNLCILLHPHERMNSKLGSLACLYSYSTPFTLDYFLDSYSIESTSGIGPVVYVLIITLQFYVAEPSRKLTVKAAILV